MKKYIPVPGVEPGAARVLNQQVKAGYVNRYTIPDDLIDL